MREARETDRGELLDGLRILIVEDVGIVAFSLKSALEANGCTVVGIAPRVTDVGNFVGQVPIDGVLLDLNLGGTYSFPLVDVLREHGIPFIIMSGYDVAQVFPELANEPQLSKPIQHSLLKELMLTVFCRNERNH